MIKRIALLFFLFSAPCWSQVTYTGRHASNGQAGQATSVTATIAGQLSGNANICAAAWCDDVACSVSTTSDTFTVNDGALNSYTSASPDATLNSTAGGDFRLTAVHASNIASSASNTITITVTTVNQVWYLGLLCSEWGNISSGKPVDQTGTVQSASRTSPLSIASAGSTAVANELVYAFGVAAGGTTLSPGAGYAVLNAPSSNYMDEYKIVSAQASQTATMTYSGSSTQQGILVTYESNPPPADIPVVF